MMTQKGRVVYNRKVHFFGQKDIERIMKAIRKDHGLENWVQMVIESFQESCRVFGEEYVPAFEYSLKAFWIWITTKESPPPMVGSRSLFTAPVTLEDLIPSEKDEIKNILIGYSAAMLNTLEEIKNYIEEEEL